MRQWLEQHRPDSYRAWRVWSGLAEVAKKRGQFEESRTVYERALGLVERTYGPRHPYVAEILRDYADLLRRAGQHNAAQQTYERAIAICEDRLGPGHPLLADCLEGYAVLLRDIGHTEEAREIKARAREVRNVTPGCPRIGEE